MTALDEAAGTYRSLILEQAARVLGRIDRQRLSPTAGCGDRTFWCWKFVDFPRSRFQEAVCVMGWLWACSGDDRFQGNPRLLGWLESALEFWCTLQHRDGSFDEAYPFERSLAATSFTSFYVAEALGFAGDALATSTRERVVATLARAGGWLCRNDESHGFLSNHLAAAAAALGHAARLTGDAALRERCRYFTRRILERQSEEGWYDEYGGADPGYQTHGSFYLARLWQLAPDGELLGSLDRATRFLAHFVHPDGSLGGEYASRNTQTYYPAAFEMLAPHVAAASWIASTMRRAVASGSAAGLRGIDAYNFYPMLNNLVFAQLACADSRSEPLAPEEPSPQPGLVHFPRAGIARVRTGRYDAYAGTTKGGVLKVFDRRERRLAFSDCGYLGRLRAGGFCSCQQQHGSRELRVEADRIEIEAGFFGVARPTMTPLRFAVFRLFTLSAGRAPALARWLKNLLVRVLIHRGKPLDLKLHRTIRLDEARVEVEDRLSGDAAGIERLEWGEVFTTIHMGSSRYFVPQELEAAPPGAGAGSPLDLSRLAEGLTLRRALELGEEA